MQIQRLAQWLAQATLAYVISFSLFVNSYALARPGGKPTRFRSAETLDHFPSSSVPTVNYQLPRSLYTPRIPEAQYQAYMEELPKTLSRLGWTSAEVTPLPMNYRDLLNIQDTIRAQMAKDKRRKQFIPILSDGTRFGRGNPWKVYALPLEGPEYRSRGLQNYAGANGGQKLAILGTALDPQLRATPPIVELYGVAHVSGAARLHSDLKNMPSRFPQVHNLGSFLDLDEVTPGTPQVPRRIYAEVERGLPIH